MKQGDNVLIDILCLGVASIATIGFGYLLSPMMALLMPAEVTMLRKLCIRVTEGVLIGGFGMMADNIVKTSVYETLDEMNDTVKKLQKIAS